MRLFVLITALLFLNSCATTKPVDTKSVKPKTVKTIDVINYKKAIDLHKKDSLEQALSYYRKVSKTSGESLWAEFGANQCLYFTGNVDSSVTLMKELSSGLTPDSTGFNTNNYIYYKTNIFLAMHYYEEANRRKSPELLKLSYIHVKNSLSMFAYINNDARVLLLYIYVKAGNYEKVIDYFNTNQIRSTSIRERNEFTLLKAISLLHTGHVKNYYTCTFKADSIDAYENYPNGLQYNIDHVSKIIEYHIEKFEELTDRRKY